MLDAENYNQGRQEEFQLPKNLYQDEILAAIQKHGSNQTVERSDYSKIVYGARLYILQLGQEMQKRNSKWTEIAQQLRESHSSGQEAQGRQGGTAGKYSLRMEVRAVLNRLLNVMAVLERYGLLRPMARMMMLLAKTLAWRLRLLVMVLRLKLDVKVKGISLR